MRLVISGFLPDPNPDEFIKYERVIDHQDEQAILKIMGWTCLEDGCDGEQEMTAEQVKRVVSYLGERPLSHLTLFISTCM